MLKIANQKNIFAIFILGLAAFIVLITPIIIYIVLIKYLQNII